ncbi:MAG: thioredoxin family protein [Gemmatimonadaceae bacterium]
MKKVQVLGAGCANCKRTAALIQQVADARGVPITLEKVEDHQQIASFGVMHTPGVVIDGVVMHAGGVPAREKVEGWMQG